MINAWAGQPDLPQQVMLEENWWTVTVGAVSDFYNYFPPVIFWFMLPCILGGLVIGGLLMIKARGNPFTAAACFIEIVVDVCKRLNPKVKHVKKKEAPDA